MAAVLVVPLVVHLRAEIADTFLGIDYFVWAAFAVEYLVKLYLAPSRRHFFTHHLVELAWWRYPYSAPCAFFGCCGFSALPEPGSSRQRAEAR